MTSFFDGYDYSCRITGIYNRTSKLGWSYVDYRKSYELVYKINGTSDQFFDDRTIRLIPHSLYFIPFRYQKNRVMVDKVGDIINICFVLHDCTNEDSFFPELIELPENNQFESMFKRAHLVWSRHKPNFKLEAQAIFMQILAEIVEIRQYEYRSSESYRRIAPAIELIEREYNRQIELSELTKLCGISGEYLRRLFRTHIGSTPNEYLRTVRLRTARELLVSSDLKISEIAHFCGFDDPRYFTRLYTREFGEPPSTTAKIVIG